MKYGSCGHENRPGARFCEACGTPLERVCSSCGCELRATAKFCDECGTPAGGQAPPARIAALPRREPRAYTPKHLADRTLPSRSALEGERKRVTVLFADVKGSMDAVQPGGKPQERVLGAPGWLARFGPVLFDELFAGTARWYHEGLAGGPGAP